MTYAKVQIDSRLKIILNYFTFAKKKKSKKRSHFHPSRIIVIGESNSTSNTYQSPNIKA